MPQTVIWIELFQRAAADWESQGWLGEIYWIVWAEQHLLPHRTRCSAAQI